MLGSIRRLTVVHQHVGRTTASMCNSCSPAPILTVQPSTCLMDDKIHIRVRGLQDNQLVTLTSRVTEAGSTFEARAAFRAGQDGTVDNRRDPSIAGTYKDVDEMGLFWSLEPSPGQIAGLKLNKKDVTTPLNFTISLYAGDHTGDTEIAESPLTTASVRRFYKHPSVRRIPVTEGPYRGTIFLPEGTGPFPGLIDTSGALVSLVENRAALLASRGFATFALAYALRAHLPKTMMAADPNYIKAAADWFSRQDYIDSNRLGAVGLSFGGYLMLMCAAMLPKLKVVVSINTQPILPAGFTRIDEHSPAHIPTKNSLGKQWPNPDAVYLTDEGIVLRDVFDSPQLICLPAWQHGAKVLLITGEDDKQVHPKWQQYLVDHWPAMYRDNVQIVTYPGTGHIIEPPYGPMTRAVKVDPARAATVDFVREEFHGHLLMNGGFPAQHAHAQEDSWRRILNFLNTEL